MIAIAMMSFINPDEQITVDEQRMKLQKELNQLTTQVEKEKQPKKQFKPAQKIHT